MKPLIERLNDEIEGMPKAHQNFGWGKLLIEARDAILELTDAVLKQNNFHRGEKTSGVTSLGSDSSKHTTAIPATGGESV